MWKARFSEEQIAYALRQVEQGTPATEFCRKLGISEQTFYTWKKRFAGMGVSELKRVRQLEEENRRLKSVVADLTLDKTLSFAKTRSSVSEAQGCLDATADHGLVKLEQAMPATASGCRRDPGTNGPAFGERDRALFRS